jgi:hypothetical protein
MNKTCKIGMLALLGYGSGAALAAVPFFDGFEGYTNGTVLATVGQNGWIASDIAVVVTNADASHVVGGTNSAFLGRGTSLTNTQGGSAQSVWTDLRIQPVLGNLPDTSIASNLSVKVAFWTNGVLAVLGTNGWDICSNDVRGAVATNAVLGQWARITIQKDYVNRLATVFLNGQCLRQLIPMTGTSTVFSCVTWEAAGGDGWLDNVAFTNGAPGGVSADVTEVAQYGYVALTRMVGVDQTYTTLSSALAADRARDTRLIIAGSVLSEGLITTPVGSTVVVSSNSTLTCTGITIGSNGVIIVSNATLSAATLDIGNSGWLYVVNGTATVGGVTQSGTFHWGNNWQTTVVPSALPFSDGFESYGKGTLLQYLSGLGWSVTNAGSLSDAVVTNAVTHASSARSVFLANYATAVQTVTNPVSGQKLWTDLWMKPVLGEAAPTVSGNENFKAYFTANGYLAVYRGGVWDVCSNDVANGSVSNVVAGDWARVTVFQDYASNSNAVFINGRLVRQHVGFARAASRYSRLEAGGSWDTEYLDDVSISNGVPTDLTVAGTPGHDVDGDGIADAVEVSLYGTTTLSPRGSVYTIR